MSDEIDRLLDQYPEDRRQSERAITADNISNQLCAELLEEIDSGDYELTDWQTDFIGDNLGREHFSPKQKSVIYNLAKKLDLL